MSYEFELRREAYKQCRETTIGISAAWWNAYRSQQHRMMHWLQLVSLANSSSSSSGSSAQMAKMQKEITDLRNEVRNRSRTPTVFQRQNNRGRAQAALPDSQQLALPASSTAAAPAAKGQGKGRGNGKRRNKAGQKKDGVWSFQQVSNSPELRNFFTPKNVNQGVCFKFQSHRCKDSNCPQLHCCIGCGGSKPYDDCHCLQDRVNALSR